MFGAMIIVFREVLEASLLIGIIAAATRGLQGRARWLALGLGAGLLGALVVAGLTESISRMADGNGQEIFNAVVLALAVLMLAWHNIWMAQHGAEMARMAKKVGSDIRNGQSELSAIAMVVALAVLREGSETALFLHGIAASNDGAQHMLAGGIIGLLVGAGLGLIIYHGLLKVPLRWFFSVTGTLLLLLAAGLASQLARVLIQVDWVPPLISPLWDSSAVLPTNSVLGSTLHVLIGYDAQPSGMQVLFYLTTLLTIWLAANFVRRSAQQPMPPKTVEA